MSRIDRLAIELEHVRTLISKLDEQYTKEEQKRVYKQLSDREDELLAEIEKLEASEGE